jgi:hypothetical protein
LGLRVTKLRSNKHINYLEFNEKIRIKKDLRDIVSANIQELKKRKIIDWMDIETILNEHLSSQRDYADALIVLASLEIHLKSGFNL